jgi:hypothetical protein
VIGDPGFGPETGHGDAATRSLFLWRMSSVASGVSRGRDACKNAPIAASRLRAGGESSACGGETRLSRDVNAHSVKKQACRRHRRY